MKIAYDYQTFSIQAYGGVSRYFVSLVEQLKLKGEDVGVFSPIYLNNYLEALSEKIVFGTKLNYPPEAKRLALLFNSMLVKQRIRNWQPDIVHETYYSIKKKIAIERADHIICVSDNTRKDLIRLLNIPKNKISVVHSGFKKYEQVEGLKEESNFSKRVKRNYILYVGHRNGYKNFSSFLQAVASSTRLRIDFDIIAFGGGTFNKKEVVNIKSLGLKTGQVTQVGGGDEVLAKLYNNASGFIFPSLYEGFGFPPLEAMAYKCPVISSNSSCMPEILGDAAEYFDPNSVEEMAIAIENVLYSDERSAALKLQGEKCLAKFSWEKCATETLEVYKKVLSW